MASNCIRWMWSGTFGRRFRRGNIYGATWRIQTRERPHLSITERFIWAWNRQLMFGTKNFGNSYSTMGTNRLIQTIVSNIHPDTKVIVAIWVDDLIIAGENTKDIKELKHQLKQEFEMKDIRALKYFLGIQLLWNRKHRQILINQNGYINSSELPGINLTITYCRNTRFVIDEIGNWVAAWRGDHGMTISSIVDVANKQIREN